MQNADQLDDFGMRSVLTGSIEESIPVLWLGTDMVKAVTYVGKCAINVNDRNVPPCGSPSAFSGCNLPQNGRIYATSGDALPERLECNIFSRVYVSMMNAAATVAFPFPHREGQLLAHNAAV